MNKSLKFYADPAKEADTLTAYIHDPDNPPPVYTCQQEGDKPYIVKSLLRRAQVLEALWFRLVGESLHAKSSKERGELARQAHAANKELTNVQSALYRIQRDNGLACVRPTELLLADAPLPAEVTHLERVHADIQAAQIYDVEFREPTLVQVGDDTA